MSDERVYRFGRFRVDSRERVVMRGETPVALTPKAFDTLLVLLRNRGRLVSKDELIRQVWRGTFVEDSNLTFNISSLRKALGEGDAGETFIETVPRYGYRFVGELPVATRATVRRAVGRAADLAALAGALDIVERGTGRLVCVTGEPGIGKTTLIEEFLEDVSRGDRPCRIGRSRCSERLAGTGAYLPLLEAVSRLCSEAPDDEMTKALGSTAPGWLAQIGPADRPSMREWREPRATSQERLKWELAAFVECISRSTRVVLFFDDMQWADISTVDVLSYLASRFDSIPVLVLAAYRPSEMIRGPHPFAAIQIDLQGRGRGRELPLGLLTRGDMDDYLAAEFPEHAFPVAFRQLIHTRTAGNALFMVDLLRYLRDRGVIAHTDGAWRLVEQMPVLERALPESTRSIIRQTIDRLDAADQRLLAAASVAGHEFLSSVVARAAGLEVVEAEDRLETLDRTHGLIRRVREQDLPDGTLSVRYRFIHAVYEDALYGALTAARKTTLSRAVADALEAHYGSDSADIAAAIAPLLAQAREFSRAARHFTRAAERALQVAANHEALALARRGLEMCEAGGSMPGREQLELPLNTMLGLAAQAVQGYAAPEVERAYSRALALARESQRSDQLIPALSGLWLCHQVRAELRVAYELAGELVSVSERSADVSVHVQAHQAMGGTLMDLGRFFEAAQHLERAIALHDRSTTRHHANVIDPGVACRAYLARVLWVCGYPDQALARADAAVSLARHLRNPQSLSLALTFAAIVHHLRLEPERTLEHAEEAQALSRVQGGVQVLAFATMWRGWALARLGQAEEGLAALREGLDATRALGSEIARPLFLARLAEALAAHGRVDEGLGLLDEALSEVARTGEAHDEAEIHRLRGKLLAQCWETLDESEASIRRALGIAQRQQALGWELRAALELAAQPIARVAADGRVAVVAALTRFTEGFDTVDVGAARALLAVE